MADMQPQKSVIYLDNNATTPIDERVLEAMMPYLTINFANANSTHLFGVGAYEAVKDARNQVAEFLTKNQPPRGYKVVIANSIHDKQPRRGFIIVKANPN